MPSNRPPGPAATIRIALHSTRTRTVALIAVVGLAGGFVIAGAGGGAAAATQYQSHSVGNFLDAAIGGAPLDQVAALQFAKADSPGTASTQNPLDVTALGAISVPLTNAITLPSFAGIDLGAVNQIARASSDGSSIGASGAVDNSGGASVGGDDTAYPSSATIDLTAAGLPGTSPIAIPGASPLAALGGITVGVHGVSGIAATDDTATAVTPKYTIADLDLTLGSPALGALLGQLTTALNDNPLSTTLSSTLSSLLGGLTLPIGGVLPTLPSSCTLTSEGLGKTLSLEDGAVTVDATSGSIAISVRKLLTALGLDLDALPANTDLTSYLLDYLTGADGLTQGIDDAVNGLVEGLENQFSTCEAALKQLDPTHLLGALVSTLTGALDSGRSQLEGVVNGLVGSLSGFGGSGNPLAAIGTALGDVLDIGVNVQHGPGAAAGNPDDRFTSALDNTPEQGTPVVAGQTLERAIEIDLLDTSTLQGSARTQAVGVGTTGVALALGNAAAGPSTPIKPTPTTTAPTSSAPTTSTPTATRTATHTPSTTHAPTTSTAPRTTIPIATDVASTAIPYAVPAGAAGHPTGGSALPLTIVLLVLLAGSGATYGFRRRLTHPRR